MGNARIIKVVLLCILPCMAFSNLPQEKKSCLFHTANDSNLQIARCKHAHSSWCIQYTMHTNCILSHDVFCSNVITTGANIYSLELCITLSWFYYFCLASPCILCQSFFYVCLLLKSHQYTKMLKKYVGLCDSHDSFH